MNKHQLHFIVGMWRSGTTLLREVLGMNPAIQVFPEHNILLRKLLNGFTWNESSKNRLIEEVMSDKDFFYFAQPNKKVLLQELEAANSLEAVMKGCYVACLQGDKKETVNRLVDKNPIYSYFLPELLEHFPNAKFIWMLREPKDNAISRAKHQIQHVKNYGYLAHWWNFTNHQIAKAAVSHPNKFLLIPYDLMVQDPKPYVQKICDFIQVPYLEDMLQFESKKDERAEKFMASVKERDGKIDADSAYSKRKQAMWENLQKPINTSKTKQWERELSAKQINQIDSYTSAYYEALLRQDFKHIPPSKMIYAMLLKLSFQKMKYEIKKK